MTIEGNARQDDTTQAMTKQVKSNQSNTTYVNTI